MDQPAEVTPLLNLGLNGYEAGAYVALTRRGRATGAEVARLSGLPRQRIYDVLDGLVGRGLATVEPGRPARYTAVAPDAAVSALLAAHRTSLERLEHDAAHAVELLTPAYHDGRSETDPLTYIEVLREPSAIAKRFDELPLKLVLIDERVALFTMEDPVAGATDLTIMIVEHPGLARLLKLAFEHAWDAGDDFR